MDLAELFEDARETQDAFWRALSRLEEALGHEVNGQQDLRDTTLEEVQKEKGAPV